MEALKAILGGRYELGPAVGSGGFGTVFRARDRRSGGDVAVKVVPPGLGSDAAAARLRREAIILGRVTSRHVARVYDSGEDEHGVWLVTELVDGGPLTIPTLGRALLPHEVLRVARGLLEGLSAVHAAGILHGDVKPSNVLVTRGDAALTSAKLVDFGLARMIARSEVAASIGEAMTRQGMVLGTARFMAPEVLGGADPTAASDLYSAAIVLFDLLDAGPLFPVGDARAQLRARVSGDPFFTDRVPAPLSDVLARMLARDPAARYRDAMVAHEAVVDLDTAPVSLVREEAAANARASVPPAPIVVSSSVRTVTPSYPPPSSRVKSSSMRPPSRTSVPPDSRRVGAPITRLVGLPLDGVAALRDTIGHLDLPMIDALARRERGNVIGRIARATALAFRLEIDAAALILEPLALQSDVARAIGATILAPRARRVTRARVDTDREDRWIETIDPELGAMLVALAVALASRDEITRDLDRCTRAVARLDAVPEATRTTVRVALTAARFRAGEITRSAAIELVAPLGGSETRPEAPLHVVLRALLIVGIVADARASGDLERAERVAADTGTTLLDAYAATALGALLPLRDERALVLLERASTLLANGDAPSLEHDAQHHRAAVLVALGRFGEAMGQVHAAGAVSREERSSERALLSASIESACALAIGERSTAYEIATHLGDARIGGVVGRVGTIAWVVRALVALSANDRDGAEDALTEAESRVRERDGQNDDVYVLVEVVGMLLDAARGALHDVEGSAAGLERFFGDHPIPRFFWFELLGGVVSQLDEASRNPMIDVLRRLQPILSRS